MSSTYIAGYRIGMLIAGAGSLYLAGFLGSELNSYNYDAWQITYACMAAVMLIGVMTTLVINEPDSNRQTQNKYHSKRDATYKLLAKYRPVKVHAQA